MRVKIILILISIFLITGCQTKNNVVDNNINNNTNESHINETSQNELDKFKKEYETSNDIEVHIPDNTLIHYAKASEIMDILTNGTGIIYFGRPTCPWCRNIIPVLADISTKYNMVINYYNPGEVSYDEKDIYQNIKQALNNYLDEDKTGQKKLYIPDVYFIKNGQVIGHHIGSVTSQNDPYIPLDNDQKEELKDIYERYINLLK